MIALLVAIICILLALQIYTLFEIGCLLSTSRHTKRDTSNLLRRVIIMSAQLDHLRTSVTSIRSASASIITVLNNIAQQLRDASNNDDLSAVEQLADDLDASASSLSQAVLANTPADPGNPNGGSPDTPVPTPEEPAPTSDGGTTGTGETTSGSTGEGDEQPIGSGE